MLGETSGGEGTRLARLAGRSHRVSILVMVGLLAVLLGAGALLAVQRQDRERAAVLQAMGNEAHDVAARVDQFFQERFETLETIALVPTVRTDPPEAIKAFFEQLVANGSSFTGGLSLIGTDGVMRLLSGFPLDEPPIDLSDRDYVQEVMSTGQRASGDAIVGRRSGDSLLTFAVPVRDPDGVLQAILAGTLRLDLPDGGVARIGASQRDVIIVDASGQVVVDRGVITRPERAAESFLASLERAGDTAATMPGPDGTGSYLAGVAPIGNTEWRAVVLRDPAVAWADAGRALSLELVSLALLDLAAAAAVVAAALWSGRAAAIERAELNALAIREAFLRRFMASLPVVAGTLDPRLEVTFANDSLEATGVAAIASLVHPDDRHLLPPIGAASDSRTVDVRLADPSSRDGTRWHRARFTADDRGSSWFFAAVDIDDAKRAEFDLQRDVQQRDEFLGLVSHELRTPLTVILGTVATLQSQQRESLTEVVLDGLRDVETSARQLQRRFENMLALSQASGLTIAPDLEPQVPARLLERTIETFRARHPEVAISLAVEPGIPLVVANATFVDQVLWNLLTNARKYGDGSTIEVSLRNLSGCVEVAVCDRGPGITLAEVEHVFDAHYRASTARSTATGLGLGLSVCRRLIELQGGTVEASVRDGGGMRVAFTILHKGEDMDDEPSHGR